MAFFKQLASRYPDLRHRLLIARIEKSPERYVRQSVTSAGMVAAVLLIGALLLALGLELPLWIVPIVGVLAYLLAFSIVMRVVDVEIRKQAKEIDKDVLFAGRFLLIKLNSGKPLITAILEAANSYGVASRTFKEIARDIELGTPLEAALGKASRYSPSDKMRRILFQISNALSIGVDVTNFLEAILDEIANDQLIEIQKYGRTLSSITMFYMLLAIILPSLGITMFITVVSLVSIPVTSGLLGLFLFLLIIIEFAFISVFRSIRPNVNI